MFEFQPNTNSYSWSDHILNPCPRLPRGDKGSWHVVSYDQQTSCAWHWKNSHCFESRRGLSVFPCAPKLFFVLALCFWSEQCLLDMLVVFSSLDWNVLPDWEVFNVKPFFVTSSTLWKRSNQQTYWRQCVEISCQKVCLAAFSVLSHVICQRVWLSSTSLFVCSCSFPFEKWHYGRRMLDASLNKAAVVCLFFYVPQIMLFGLEFVVRCCIRAREAAIWSDCEVLPDW